MVFGAVMPATVGLANWMIPLQIGAPDMALPRMNNFSFWLLVSAFSLLILSLFMPGGGPASGWTLYPPLCCRPGDAFPLAIFAIHLAGRLVDHGRHQHHRHDHEPARTGHVAAEDAAVRLDVADHGLPADRSDAVFAGAVTMLLTDHFFHTTFFAAVGRRRPGALPAHFLVLRASRGLHHDPAGVRDRLRDHPDVRAQAPVRLRRDGLCDASIAFLSFIVWAHHMFTVGHAARRRDVLHAVDDADRRADRA
jgi:cytochrome c oxidase subunit 1